MSHVTFYDRKTDFWSVKFLRDHYALLFYILLQYLILLYFEIDFAQDSKKFWEMDIIDVQNRDRRNLFVQIRRALGNLRNFFGTHFAAWHVQWELLDYVNITLCLSRIHMGHII